MKRPSRSTNTQGIVLKRSNVGETDRVVTLLTPDFGRVVTVAKGVRKISSSKRAFLEPGNYVKVQLIHTKSMPLLIQATLLKDCALIRTDLSEIRKMVQFLEILEKLFVEEEIDAALFQRILKLRDDISQKKITNRKIKTELERFITDLGYQSPQETKHDSILDYVAELADRPMKSFEYLAPKK